MPIPITYPTQIIPIPFAANGSKNTIPIMPDSVPGHASLSLGYPPLTMTAIQDGGVPPSGLDMNGIFYLATQHLAFLNNGGLYKFSAALVAETGGYNIGSVLQSNDGLSLYLSLVNNNTVDFNTTPSSIGTNWTPVAGAALNGTVATVNTTGGTTTLTPSQYTPGTIVITGTLTSNAAIVFPSILARVWRIINSTSGAFSVVAKVAAGVSLPCTQGKTNTVFYDGSQLQFPDYDSGLDSPAFRGSPTAPTAPPLSNNTLLSTTAYVDGAIASATLNVALRYVNSAITAGPTGYLMTDTTAGPFTITLPASPMGANLLFIQDIGQGAGSTALRPIGSWSTNNLTIARNGKTINLAAEDLICNSSGSLFGLVYDSTTNNWRTF